MSEAGKWWNIKTLDTGELMLGLSCDLETAEQHLKRFQSLIGKPWPNGRGRYNDRGFHIVAMPSQDGFINKSELEP